MSSHLQSRGARVVAVADGSEYEVTTAGAASDEEAMFEFDSDTEAREYERGHAALVKELSAKARVAEAPVKAEATSGSSSSSSATATPQVGGMATVVQINILPSADGVVDVGMNVIDRYVPHLNAAKVEILPPTGEITSTHLESAVAASPASASSPPAAAASSSSAAAATVSKIESDDDSDSDDSAAADADTTGADLVLTGDLDKDQSLLAKLMAGKDTEMAGEGDSSSDSSDDEDDEEDIARRAQAATLEDIGSDEEPETVQGKAKGVYTKNELKPEEIPAPAEFAVGTETTVEEIGQFASCIDRLLVIASLPGRSKVLDIGSAICTEARLPVGRVEEVIGLVSEPYYAVRMCASFDPSTLPDPLDDDEIITRLYYVPSLSSFAQADVRPGTDASNMHDEEVAEDEEEFSDDEAEAEARAERKNKKKTEAIEKKRAAAIAAGQDPDAVLPGARKTFKAKRVSTGANANAAAAAPQATPAAAPAQAPSAGANAPLLPMPGTAPAYAPYGQPQQPFSMAPGNYHMGQAHAQHYHQQQAAAHHAYQQQQQAYSQYYAQHPQASVGYYQPPHAVAGGFAGWGAQNLGAAAPQQPYPYAQHPYAQQQPAYGYPPHAYGAPPAGAPPAGAAPQQPPAQ